MSENNRIFFGSLEHSIDRDKFQNRAVTQSSGTSSPPESSSPPRAEIMAFSEKSMESQQKYRNAMMELESKKRARAINIPTDDKVVQMKLRELGEPIILFGEMPPDRRERLKSLMTRLGIEDAMPSTVMLGPKETQKQEAVETFYTEGSQDLRNARLFIAKYSLPKARERIQRAKRQRIEDDETELKNENADIDEDALKTKQYEETFTGFTNVASEVGDERPLSYITFNKDGSQIATAGWSGNCKIWNVNTCKKIHELNGHKDRSLCVIYHPNAENMEPTTSTLASCGADGLVNIWNMKSHQPVRTFQGHTNRVNRVAYHPSGRFLGSASMDMTWKLWDIESGKELLDQEGHARGVYGIGFQNDGALVATAGYDEIGRVWDLRSGRSIWVLRGHNKAIHGVEWNPNGYQLATWSEDNTIRIWDVRKKRIANTIPAHDSLISHAKFTKGGELMISSSFDMTIRIWNTKDWTLAKNIKGTEAKIMGVDLSPDFTKIVTANYDRTWRIFAKEI